MGPNSFSLDRLIAILGSFLADNHANPLENVDRADPEIETWRVSVFVSVRLIRFLVVILMKFTMVST